MSVDMSSKIDELAHNMGEVINRADALMDKFEKNEGDIAGIEEKLEKAATTDKDNSFSGNNSFEKPISIPEATKENEGINLGQADSKYGKLLTQNLKWSVGAGGNFSNLQDALNEALKYIVISYDYSINIKLKTGYKLNSQIKVKDALMSHIVITSEDDDVKLSYEKVDNYAFIFEGCVLPKLKILVNAENKAMRGMSLTSCLGVLKFHTPEEKNKFGFTGFRNMVIAANTSSVELFGLNISNNGKNYNSNIDVLYCSANGKLVLTDCNLDNNGNEDGLWIYYSGYNSSLTLKNCSIKNNKSKSNILNNNNSYLNAQESNFTGSKAQYLLRNYNGAQTNLSGINTTSCTWSTAELPFAVNTLTKDGIIYK
ncbi:hypothetical protein KJQ75_06020 [Campylobacter lari]|uniref:hypothetical protein n=1 Tax=Campylobacter lari TaxID=201 RepID=UPI0012C83D5E|nr:hypothetical protein [Campylobacter lari]MBT0828389.1 hypothetical protein [Campylobacter lari]